MAMQVLSARSFYLAMWGNLLGRPYVLVFALPAICAVFLAAPTVVSASSDHGSVHSSARHAQQHGSRVNRSSQLRIATTGGQTKGGGSTTSGTVQQGSHGKLQHNAAGGAAPAAVTHVSSTAAPRPTSPQLFRSGFLSATTGTASSHPPARSSKAPAASGGVPPAGGGVPSPSSAPVVIGSGGVVGPAPLRLATASNWAPLVVVLLLLCLVVLALVLTSRRRRRVDFPPPPVGGHF